MSRWIATQDRSPDIAARDTEPGVCRNANSDRRGRAVEAARHAARRGRALVVATFAGLTLLAGCVPSSKLSNDQIDSTISDFVLDPTKTCTELRDDFGLTQLEVVDTPDQAGMDYVDQAVLTADGATIHVWYLPTKLNRGTIVLSPGASGTMACYLFVTRLLVRDGWSVFMYEYEGFGVSSGAASVNTLADDCEAVVDWARQISGRPRVTLMGISIGSIPSVAVAVRRPDAVNAVVLDSPVVISAELDRFNLLLGGRSGYVADQLDPELLSDRIIGDMQAPLLVYLNEADQVTPPSSIEMLYEAATSSKRLVSFPKLDHALGPYVNTAGYTFNLELFLTSVWTRDALGDVLNQWTPFVDSLTP